MAVGPLQVADEVSLELMLHILEETKKAEGDKAVNLRVLKAVQTLVHEHQRKGKKSRQGFYDYTESTRSLWPGLAHVFPQASTQPSLDTLKERLLSCQRDEARRCLKEGILLSELEGNVGAILGLGFPPTSGGPLYQLAKVRM
jgi:3-hydroxyacyl-CoA dehydrogenase/enoyl-CoA hydratase/3-hydroxybutyryl-CoA epimerase